MEKNAINSILVALFAIFSLQAQQPLESGHYNLMEQIMGRDTVLLKEMSSILKNQVENGKSSPQDTINYINFIRNRRLRLKPKALNAWFKRKLFSTLNEDPYVYNWIGAELDSTMINEIPSHFVFDKNGFSEEIEILEETRTRDLYHQFSTPLEIENNIYLILWSKIRSGFSFIKYSLETDGKAKIIGSYSLGIY